MLKACNRHGLTEHTEQDRCCKCVIDIKKRKARRNKNKILLVEYKGGKCERCGYSKCIGALEFHHIDPQKKDFSLSAAGRSRSLDTMKKEVDKCILLCANCHREEHFDYGK